MKNVLLLLAVLTVSQCALASLSMKCHHIDHAAISVNTMQQDEVKTIAGFRGGNRAMMEYIQQNLIYPKACKKAGIQGRVLVSFTVDKKGKIKNVTGKFRPFPSNSHSEGTPEYEAFEQSRNIKLEEQMVKEAVRVVKKMPNWMPAVNQQDEPVDFPLNLPILFR